MADFAVVDQNVARSNSPDSGLWMLVAIGRVRSGN